MERILPRAYRHVKYALLTRLCNHAPWTVGLIGVLYSKPAKGGDVIFYFKLTGFSTEFIHTKKRQLKGSLRKKIASELLDANKDANV